MTRIILFLVLTAISSLSFGQTDIFGCTDLTACNYDATANIDDDSCDYVSCYVFGCLNEFACNYDPLVDYDDGTCDFTTCADVYGCTYSDASNYNAESTIDDGSCIYEEYDLDAVYDSGYADGIASVICPEISNCPSDLDGNGDVGMSDLLIFLSAFGDVCEIPLDFSPDIDIHLGNNIEASTTSITYMMSQDNNESEIFSSSVVSDGGMFNLDDLVVGSIIGSGTLHLELYAGNYDISSNLIVSNIYNSNYTIFNEVTSSTSPTYNVGDIAGGFVISNSVSGISIYTEVPTDDDYITEAYFMSLTFNDLFTNPSSGNLTFTSTLTSELGDVDVQEFILAISTVSGCTDPSANNYDDTANSDDGSCEYDVYGCTVDFACNYNPDANNDDGSCDYVSCYVFGCDIPEACNYDPEVTINDGTCDFISCADECGVPNGDNSTCLDDCGVPNGDDSSCVLTPITNDNIHAAVDLWLLDESQAEATYGHISDWDVSSITDMNNLFLNASSFNGDLYSWNVSSVTNMTTMFNNASSFNGDLSAWDVSSVTNMVSMFNNASSFNGDLSAWDVSSVTNMDSMFEGASSFNGDLSSWDVSSVTIMSGMFVNASSFNGDLSSWDVSSVTDMNWMFGYASSFNGDLSAWDVSSVTAMIAMFNEASIFNGNISSWDVSSVINMGEMFYSASSFNVDISSWDVSSVTDMSRMFQFASSFNGDISSWNVSNVTTLGQMFQSASSFNGDLSSWDVSSVLDMSWMFQSAIIFNGDISSWDVSSVTDMSHLFAVSTFNGDISSWDVSSVETMSEMFNAASTFNGDLSSWDVSSVTNMRYMLQSATSFNGDISAWDVSSVTNMYGMFYAASSFNGDLSAWDVSSVTDMDVMFAGASALSEENQCLIHTSFSSNANWPYDWSEFCSAACGDLVSHEGYDYSTVQIGDQCWFSENCRYLPEVSPSIDGSETDPYYYVYDYQGTDVEAAKATENYETYGVLYNWPAVMTEGICPSGWHVPSDEEFTQLTDFLGAGVAGYAMKSTTGWNNNGNGSNSSGWAGLPNGVKDFSGFNISGSHGFWWSSSVSGSESWRRVLNDSFSYVSRDDDNHLNGFSARCIQD